MLQIYTKFFYFDALNCENHIKCDRYFIFYGKLIQDWGIFATFAIRIIFFLEESQQFIAIPSNYHKQQLA